MAITYDAGTNIITIVGYTEATPCTFTDIYNADKAGTLSLHARTGITAADTDPVAVDRAERPADYIVLGGTSNDLYITIANWSGTTATIRITGTDRDGTTQTEDIVVTANGDYYTTKWFKTITQTQVTAFTGTSFDYELIQGQWGVVSRQCDNQFCFDAGLIVGDGSTVTWFADTNKHVQFNVFNVDLFIGSSYQGAVRVNANANFRLGEILSAAEKVGVNGCTCYFNAPPANQFGIIAHESGNLKLYSSHLSGTITFGSGGGNTPAHTGNLTVWNTIFEQALYVTSANSDLNRALVNRGDIDAYGLSVNNAGATITRPSIFGANDGALSFYTSGIVAVKDAYIRDCDNLAIIWGETGTYNIINADSDVWTIYRYHSGSEIVQKQFEIDLKVIDKDNVPIDNATVKIWDKDSTLVVDTTTNASGIITTQTLTAAICEAGNSTFNLLKTPHLIKIGKAGYTPYEADFPLEEKTDWTIALQTGGGGLMRNPPMTGGMV